MSSLAPRSWTRGHLLRLRGARYRAAGVDNFNRAAEFRAISQADLAYAYRASGWRRSPHPRKLVSSRRGSFVHTEPDQRGKGNRRSRTENSSRRNSSGGEYVFR